MAPSSWTAVEAWGAVAADEACFAAHTMQMAWASWRSHKPIGRCRSYECIDSYRLVKER